MFLCCGEALYDLFQDQTDGRFDARLGGSPLNVAIGLARLGHKSAFLGAIGKDFLAEKMRQRLRDEGVDIYPGQQSDAPTPLALISVRDDGVPFYSFHGLDNPAPFEVPSLLPPSIKAIHVGSVGVAFGPSAMPLLRLLQKEQGKLFIAYDPNLRPTIVSDASLWRAPVEAIAACADMIKISKEDLEFLSPGLSSEALAERWLAGRARLVVVTDGPAGAQAFSRTQRADLPAPRATVIDTVGAGDAFQSALLAACAEHDALSSAGLEALSAESLTQIINFAIRAGSLTCTRSGAAMPTRAEMREKEVLF
jgi:fructokinase